MVRSLLRTVRADCRLAVGLLNIRNYRGWSGVRTLTSVRLCSWECDNVQFSVTWPMTRMGVLPAPSLSVMQILSTGVAETYVSIYQITRCHVLKYRNIHYGRYVNLFLTFMGLCIFKVFLNTTNKMQRYTVFFIVVSAVHVSSGFSAHHQELKNCTCSIGY